MKKQLFAHFILLLFLASSMSMYGQIEESNTQSKQRASLYYLGERDELLIKVNIWGFVLKPGQYLVPTDTDLISLISFAGGPVEEAKLKKVKVIRNTALLSAHYSNSDTQFAMNGKALIPVPITRNDQLPPEDVKKVIEVDVEKYLETGDESLVPDLMPGDTIVLEGSAFHFISKVFEFASKVAVVAQVYWWIQVAKK